MFRKVSFLPREIIKFSDIEKGEGGELAISVTRMLGIASSYAEDRDRKVTIGGRRDVTRVNVNSIILSRARINPPVFTRALKQAFKPTNNRWFLAIYTSNCSLHATNICEIRDTSWGNNERKREEGRSVVINRGTIYFTWNRSIILHSCITFVDEKIK